MTNNIGGIGFFGLLTIVFIVLKLTGYIAWSWFWVLSPIIFSTILGLIILFIIGIYLIIK
jgi:FtsH-binding integral membrane protein